MFHRMKNNPVVNLLRVMWLNARGKRGWMVAYMLFASLAIVVDLSRPLIIAELMNAVQFLRGEELIERATFLLALFVGLGVLFWLLHGPSRFVETVMAYVIKSRHQSKLFRKITELPTKWHRDNHSGELIDQNAKGAQALGEFSESSFEVIHVVTMFIGATVMLTYVMPVAGIAVIISVILAMTVVLLFDRVLIGRYEALNKRFNEVAAAIQDYLTNVSTVKSLRLEERVSEEVAERMDRVLPVVAKTSLWNESKWFSASLMVNLTRAAIILTYIVVMVRSGKVIEVGTMYALVEYLNKVADAFFQFTWKYGDIVVKNTRVTATNHIEEAHEGDVRAQLGVGLPANWQTITIEHLHYAHHDGVLGEGPPAGVRDISLTLERGRSYALVGESGSGKSTVLSLIRGMHEPDRCEVTCDGKSLPHGMTHVAHHSTLIPQEPEIFSDTIWFNITMDVEATREEVDRAVKLALFEQKLASFPKRYDTSIAEKGVNLSGGEKQRLALARGLFFAADTGSDFILMDEPTSSLDERREYLIYQGLLKNFADRCVMSAIHKLQILPLFDQVLVFAGGRLVEQGTYEELMRSGSELRRLHAEAESEAA